MLFFYKSVLIEIRKNKRNALQKQREPRADSESSDTSVQYPGDEDEGNQPAMRLHSRIAPSRASPITRAHSRPHQAGPFRSGLGEEAPIRRRDRDYASSPSRVQPVPGTSSTNTHSLGATRLKHTDIAVRSAIRASCFGTCHAPQSVVLVFFSYLIFFHILLFASPIHA